MRLIIINLASILLLSGCITTEKTVEVYKFQEIKDYCASLAGEHIEIDVNDPSIVDEETMLKANKENVIRLQKENAKWEIYGKCVVMLFQTYNDLSKKMNEIYKKN